jgi:hypothetical protein
MQFELEQLTPKAFANFNPRLERCDNPGINVKIFYKPCKGSAIGERFQRLLSILIGPPGLKLANAFGVSYLNSNCIPTRGRKSFELLRVS